MILIFKGPGTTRVIPDVVEVMGFDFITQEFIPGRPFGWFRRGSHLGFGCMPEFFEKRFTHIALIGGPGANTFFGQNLLWIHGDGWMLSPGVHGNNPHMENAMRKKAKK